MILKNCLTAPDQIRFERELKHSAWNYTLSSGEPDSRVCWCADLADSELVQQLALVINQRVPGAWQVVHAQGISQTLGQPHITPETEPAACETLVAHYHPMLMWQTRWWGATIIDGDRIEYEPNSMIIRDAHLPVHREAPQTPNICRTTVELRLERRF